MVQVCTFTNLFGKEDKPVFSGDAYAGLSETALHYIGGILKHAKAINAFAKCYN